MNSGSNKTVFLIIAFSFVCAIGADLFYSSDTIRMSGRYGTCSDKLVIRNSSLAQITIDTISEWWQTNGSRENIAAEISFDTVIPSCSSSLSSPHYYYRMFRNITDSSFYTTAQLNPFSPQLFVAANDSILLAKFIFGNCIYCTGKRLAGNGFSDTATINLVFKASNGQKDTVVFIGLLDWVTSALPREAVIEKNAGQVTARQQGRRLLIDYQRARPSNSDRVSIFSLSGVRIASLCIREHTAELGDLKPNGWYFYKLETASRALGAGQILLQ